MDNNLWEKDLYLNKNILYLFNHMIREYDMAEAGFSIIREYRLLPESDIKNLLKYSKQDRHIMIGKMEKTNDKLKQDLKKYFSICRKNFFLENNIEESDIISIKKDAIFTIKECEKQKYGEFIYFRPKHIYTSYIQLNKQTEIYYSSKEFSVKGIKDENLKYHEDYIIEIIKTFFKKMETQLKSDVLTYLCHMIDKYKTRQLDIGFYRNFNRKSDFTLISDEDYDTNWEDNIDISYNLFNVLIKLVKIAL